MDSLFESLQTSTVYSQIWVLLLMSETEEDPPLF